MSAVYDIEKIDFIRDHCTNDFNAMIYVESSFDLNVYLSGKDAVIVSMENKETQKVNPSFRTVQNLHQPRKNQS